jgi:hypothetical protein
VSHVIYRNIEEAVSARALAAGLAVTFSRHRFLDSVTIVAASFEMQMFVLTRLGKRPNLPLTLRMLQRCLASLFVNLYLNGSDAIEINVLIRKAALGVELSAALLDEARETIGDIDFSDLDADEFLSDIGGAATAFLSNTLLFTMTVGSTALHQIARFIDRNGNELVQGALAGGMLYWQGTDLAAEVLARDREQRRQPPFNRTIRDGAASMAQRMGELLRVAARQLRAGYRGRKRRAVKAIKNKFVGGRD